jgi:hypothetical protein
MDAPDIDYGAVPWKYGSNGAEQVPALVFREKIGTYKGYSHLFPRFKGSLKHNIFRKKGHKLLSSNLNNTALYNISTMQSITESIYFE